MDVADGEGKKKEKEERDEEVERTHEAKRGEAK